mmetsp:Transcript_22635/g.68022  ORF Transcript_22635/g.68022 Transcript_22635/m.68022 type:complete len:265 (+) Transcript_22635:1803-2597(+)
MGRAQARSTRDRVLLRILDQRLGEERVHHVGCRVGHHEKQGGQCRGACILRLQPDARLPEVPVLAVRVLADLLRQRAGRVPCVRLGQQDEILEEPGLRARSVGQRRSEDVHTILRKLAASRGRKLQGDLAAQIPLVVRFLDCGLQRRLVAFQQLPDEPLDLRRAVRADADHGHEMQGREPVRVAGAGVGAVLHEPQHVVLLAPERRIVDRLVGLPLSDAPIAAGLACLVCNDARPSGHVVRAQLARQHVGVGRLREHGALQQHL